ncbi:hypothetical protein AB0I84_18800 [Streptomyces spectabilis]|uniref:hypothetical protein n=1 Tax=Streptomyces spectabilis TaxID=68270 RepID=UPI0033ED2BAF
MEYGLGDRVHHMDYPPSTATVVSFPDPWRVVVRWESTGRTSEENASLIELD